MYEDFPKLHSPFKRIKVGSKYLVTNEIDTDYSWVFEDSNVMATEKLDGTNICVNVEKGRIKNVYNRNNEKDIFKVKSDTYTTMIAEGIYAAIKKGWLSRYEEEYIYGEIIGEKINANRHKIKGHLFVPFNYLKDKFSWNSYHKYPKTYESISEWFKELPSLFAKRNNLEETTSEGIVFHHPDGRMAKLRRDMFDWYKGKGHKQ